MGGDPCRSKRKNDFPRTTPTHVARNAVHARSGAGRRHACVAKLLIGGVVSVVLLFGAMIAFVSYQGNKLETTFREVSNTLPQ